MMMMTSKHFEHASNSHYASLPARIVIQVLKIGSVARSWSPKSTKYLVEADCSSSDFNFHTKPVPPTSILKRHKEHLSSIAAEAQTMRAHLTIDQVERERKKETGNLFSTPLKLFTHTQSHAHHHCPTQAETTAPALPLCNQQHHPR